MINDMKALRSEHDNSSAMTITSEKKEGKIPEKKKKRRRIKYIYQPGPLISMRRALANVYVILLTGPFLIRRRHEGKKNKRTTLNLMDVQMPYSEIFCLGSLSRLIDLLLFIKFYIIRMFNVIYI